MSDTSSERRRFRRYVRSMPVQYEVERDRAWVPGHGQLITLNVGVGGAKIRVDEALEEGQYLRLRMALDGNPVSTVGRVVWVHPSRVEGMTLAGVQFDELEAASRTQLEQALASS